MSLYIFILSHLQNPRDVDDNNKCDDDIKK